MRDPAPARIWLVLIRGDHELNEVKVSKVPGLNGGFRFATEAEILQHFGCKPGYLGPIGTLKPVTRRRRPNCRQHERFRQRGQ